MLKTEGSPERVPLAKLALVSSRGRHSTFFKREKGEKATHRLNFWKTGSGFCSIQSHKLIWSCLRLFSICFW